MRMYILTCAAALTAAPASGQELALAIDLLPGHPIHHESEGEAGVVMAISITPSREDSRSLTALCEELRLAAGLQPALGDGLPLEVVFVVPYKDMAVEGYYLPADRTSGSEALVRGHQVARAALDGIIGRAGIPPSLLDQTDVEHEISCETKAPAWLIRWEDVRLIGDEAPEAVIDRAQRRFMAIHQEVVAHGMALRDTAEARPDGADRAGPSQIASRPAAAPGGLSAARLQP